MKKPIMIPELGDDVETVKIVEWLVKAGDSVSKGDSIAIIETEKVAFEVEAPESGVIEKFMYPEGKKVLPSKPIAYMVESDGSVDKADDTEQVSEAEQKTGEPEKGLRRFLRRISSKHSD